MRFSVPTLNCDGRDGECTRWTVDYYEQCASTVDGTPITRTQRAPGWHSNSDGSDYCPTHAPATDETT